MKFADLFQKPPGLVSLCRCLVVVAMPVPRLTSRESGILLLQFPDVLRLTSKQSQGLPSSGETSAHAMQPGWISEVSPVILDGLTLFYTWETDSGKKFAHGHMAHSPNSGLCLSGSHG